MAMTGTLRAVRAPFGRSGVRFGPSKPRAANLCWRRNARPCGRKRLHCAAVSPEVAELQEKFAISGCVDITEGEGGLPKVVLQHACGSSAEVYLFGACVTSWKQSSGDEVLFVRPDAKFDKSKPISGGIPICFPQFGPGKIQQHGFARNLDFTIASTSADYQPDERDPEVELVLSPSTYTEEMYPHPFKVVYSISLHGETLNTDFRVINEGGAPLEFTAALHSYFEVAGIDKAKVRGLRGVEYLDKVVDANNPPRKTQEEGNLEFKGPVDSVYLGVPGYVDLDVGTGAAIAITFDGWEDVTVWNPWTDMPACYENFVCVENVKYGKPATVQPEDSWRGTTSFQVVDL
ncbi:unnamed protein product [Ostreobium quekettii]|uniref:glucose-6-phosphate 1-epimerase n=1 Tax=Ostreobium quekettii TaxID=121088 RepID=A0A8S1JA94_9CHLO|nr:unnamed protein product [Ostreobium quekettii]